MTLREHAHAGRVAHPALEAFYAPRSVVVIGASRQPGKLGHDVMVECRRLGFAGPLWGVNPHTRGERVAGFPLVRSLGDLPVAPDLALVAVPAAGTPEAVGECARAGVQAAVLAASGLGELGGESAVVEQEIARVAHDARMRLLGPNGFGLYVGPIGLNLMGWRDVPTGRVALITQSGNVAIALCRLMARSTVGLSSCTGIGNQLDVGAAELIAHHARSEDSDAIALYLEGLRDAPGTEFVEALAVSNAAGKPVVVLKGGRSKAGVRSVTTHTGALGGDREIWDVALRQGGARQVSDPDELVEVLEAFRATRGRRVRGVLVLTDGGGDTVLASDALEEAGVPLAALSEATQRALDDMAPPAAPRADGQNPVTLDTAGGLEDDPALLATCAEVGAHDDAVDAVVVAGTFGGYRARRTDELDAVTRLAALYARGMPVLVHSAFASDDEEPVIALRRAGIPVYRTVRRLAGSLGKSIDAVCASTLDAVPRQPSGTSELLSAADAMALLDSVGVSTPPIVTFTAPEEIAAGVDRVPFPVCLKVDDPKVVHKSDVGGVVLDLGPGEVEEAARELWRRFPGSRLVVMPMLARGVELLVGLGRDPTFGSYVIVGRGGVTAELDPDVAMALTPCDEQAALTLWSSLRCAPLLGGWRASRGVDLASLSQLVAALSRLAEIEPVLEIECNPVIAYPDGYGVADVRAVRARG